MTENAPAPTNQRKAPTKAPKAKMQSLATGGASCCKWAREWRFMPVLDWKWFIYSCLAVQIINLRCVSREWCRWSPHHCSDKRALAQSCGPHTPLFSPWLLGPLSGGHDHWCVSNVAEERSWRRFRSESITCCSIIWGRGTQVVGCLGADSKDSYHKRGICAL